MLGLGSNIASIGSHCSVSSFSPEDVSNLQLWLKNNHSLTVAQWDDSSGNGHHAAQGTSGNQAAVSEGGLDFEGTSNHHYDLANTGVVVSSQEAFIIFIVCKIESFDNQNSILGTGDDDIFLEFQTAKKIRFKAGGTAIAIDYPNGTFATGAKAVFAIQREAGATGNINLFKNGSAVSPDSQLANAGAITFNVLATRNNDRFFDGIIHELLCYETANLTSDEITNINNYLTTKHGI
tara:strand:+ start:423 stop:1130 length:708 start_codon:yes stop_codon:yes gene_type:complete